jgi:biotin transport system substrate-specific component
MKAYLVRMQVVRSISAQKAVMVLAGVGILAASAWLSVPFYPVPLTMQTLAVLLIGGTLGPAMGVSSVIGYLALGAAGAPVFHGGLGGVAVLGGPTGGYLIGFIPAAFLMGLASRLAGRRPAVPSLRSAVRRMTLLAAGAVLASLAIYAVGLPWLGLVTGMGLHKVLSVGAVPFLLGDLLKVAVAVGAVYLGSKAARHWRPSLF